MPRLNLVCVDKTDTSENAFQWYAENHHRDGDVVGLVHIHQMPQLPSMGLMAGSIPLTDDYHKSIKSSVEESQKIVNKYVKKVEEGLKATCKILKHESHHSPGQLICDIADEHNADIIVMGQRGLSSFSRALLGSTSDYVLHHSERTVIIVPPPKGK